MRFMNIDSKSSWHLAGLFVRETPCRQALGRKMSQKLCIRDGDLQTSILAGGLHDGWTVLDCDVYDSW